MYTQDGTDKADLGVVCCCFFFVFFKETQGENSLVGQAHNTRISCYQTDHHGDAIDLFPVTLTSVSGFRTKA